MDVAILEQETFVVRLGIISLIKLSPKVAGWEHLALLFARHSVFGIKVEHVHNVVQFSATSVVFRGTIINWRIIRSCCTFITRFQSIASLEQKTLHVIGRIIIDAKHGEEFTLSNLLTFPLARPTISNVMKVNVHHVV